MGPEKTKYKVLTSPSTGLKVAQSELKLLLKPHHFQKGLLVAKCVASMLTMHWQSSDIKIKEESPTLASVVDHSNGSGKNATSTSSQEKTELLHKKSSAPSTSVGSGFNIPDYTMSSVVVPKGKVLSGKTYTYLRFLVHHSQ